MEKITIKKLLEICNGSLLCGNESLECIHFSKDTREIKKGDIYIGISGTNFDGNKFYIEAFENGAAACILDCKPSEKYLGEKTIVIVPDTVKCIQTLALYKRKMYDIPVIGITGSVGKTTTREMICSVLESKYKVLTPVKNYNNHIGLPFTLLGLEDHTACVLEMGMNHLGEISVLSKIAKPTISIITNIGSSHIGNMGSKENILKAKLEILDGMIKEGTLIINNDDELLKTVNYKNKITTGIINNSDYKATLLSDNEFEINDIRIKNDNINSSFVYNSLNAVAVGILLGVPEFDIIKALNSYTGGDRRLKIINAKNNITVIDDSYNSSYESIKIAIEMLKKYNKRKIMVLGDIKELGDKAMEIHNNLSVLIDGIDVLVTVGEYTKYINAVIKNNNFSNNENAIKYIKKIIKKDDVILIKASNSMKFDEIVRAFI